MNKKDRLTIAASIFICLYSLLIIVVNTSNTFSSIRLARLTFSKGLQYLLLYNISYWSLLALGICGFILVYANTTENKELSFQNRLSRMKNIVFAALIVLSTGSLFAVLYNAYVSYQAYQNNLSLTIDVMGVSFQIALISMVISALISIGGILFGLSIIAKREGLLKPVSIIYITGFSVSLLMKIYDFITALSQNGLMTTDPTQISLFGPIARYLVNTSFIFIIQILMMVASLIIILYGIKKEKIAASE
ncbi:MAG: hypothetical protein ACYCYM_11495 [Saccharofermentanales bacterium]